MLFPPSTLQKGGPSFYPGGRHLPSFLPSAMITMARAGRALAHSCPSFFFLPGGTTSNARRRRETAPRSWFHSLYERPASSIPLWVAKKMSSFFRLAILLLNRHWRSARTPAPRGFHSRCSFPLGLRHPRRNEPSLRSRQAWR